jgi:rare lipoprotein A
MRALFFSQSLTWLSFIFVIVSFVGCSSIPPEPTPPKVTQIPPVSNPTNTSRFSDFPRPTAPVRKIVPRKKMVPSQRGNLSQAALRKPISIRGYIERGRASWYSVKQHGAKTASGQLYDLYGMTAAHATLPLMSRVRVKNLRTGRHVIITINDRLYSNNVLIKLSYWSARYLGVVKRPSQKLEIRGL